MSWVTPRTAAVGDVFTAAWVNEIKGELEYLHGDDGQVSVNDGIQSEGSVTGGNIPSFVMENTAASKQGRWWMDDAGEVIFDFPAGASNVIVAKDDGTWKVNGMRVLRHTGSADHHIESGVATTDATGTVSITFTTAFTSTPVVVATLAEAEAEIVRVTARSTTGATFQVVSTGGTGEGSQDVCWIAVGE